MKKFKFLLLALLAIFVTGVVAAKDLKEKRIGYKFFPSKVVLEGKIRKMRVFQNAWDEDEKRDPMVDIPILVLENPINVKGTGDKNDLLNQDDVDGVQEIQIDCLGSNFKKLIVSLNKKVKVSGTLSTAAQGGDHTEVVLDLEKIISIH
jgi:hypothetical protein